MHISWRQIIRSDANSGMCVPAGDAGVLYKKAWNSRAQDVIDAACILP